MAAWFGGSYNGAKDVGIYSSNFINQKWSKPKCVVKPLVINNDTLPCWKPILFNKHKAMFCVCFIKLVKNPREWFGAMIS